MAVKKALAFVMIVMIIALGISIEKDISNVKKENIYDNYINYNIMVNPDNLKQTNSINNREKDLLVNLFEGLVKKDEQGEIVGGLAEDFNISEDGVEYNFILRKDIYYSSGEKILAEDFAKFFKDFLEDEENIYREELDCIYGAKAFREGDGDFSQVAIIAKEDMLTIRLNYPCPYLMDILANPIYVLRDYNILENYKNNYKDIRYTGPFVIKEASNEQLILEKNERFYDALLVTDERIRVSFIESPEDALAIFEDSGSITTEKVDIILDGPINEVQRLDEAGLIEKFKGNEVINIVFNDDEERLSGTMEFRGAISEAIDREGYAQVISKNLLIPTYITTPSMEDTIEVFNENYQIYAKEYFEKTDLTEEVPIKIIYEDNSLQRRIAKELCEQLQEYTGLEFTYEGYSKEEILKIMDEEDYDILLDSFQFRYDYEGEYYDEVLSSIMDKEEYKEALNNSKYESDEAVRKGNFERCEELLKERLSIIPLLQVNKVACVKPQVEGLYITMNGNVKLDKVKRVR